MVDEVAKVLGVPVYKAEATKFTASGYVGDSVKSLISGLLREANYDVQLAERGIVYLDEIDKITSHETSGIDVRGGMVQEELLKMFEGSTYSFTVGKKVLTVDTTNILFICGGAFVGLDEIVAKRMGKSRNSIGFKATVSDLSEGFEEYLPQAQSCDFVAFGFKPELVGRLPVRLFVRGLTADELEIILTEPKKALCKQMVSLCAPATRLFFTKGAIRAMAEEALKSGTNGRALREIMMKTLAPVLYDEPETAVISAEDVLKRNEPLAEDSELPPKVTAHSFLVGDDIPSKFAALVAELSKSSDSVRGAGSPETQPES